MSEILNSFFYTDGPDDFDATKLASGIAGLVEFHGGPAGTSIEDLNQIRKGANVSNGKIFKVTIEEVVE